MMLLDTHAWLWMTLETSRLGPATRARLEDGAQPLYLSAASSWEMAIKFRIGRLDLPERPSVFVPTQVRLQGIDTIDITHAHALAVDELPLLHGDPFDRLLIVQAQQMNVPIVTVDPQIMRYDVETLDART